MSKYSYLYNKNEVCHDNFIEVHVCACSELPVQRCGFVVEVKEGKGVSDGALAGHTSPSTCTGP